MGPAVPPLSRNGKRSLRAGVPEHGEAEQPLIHLLLTGAASQCSSLGVSSHSAQCRSGQGVKAPVGR